MLQQGIHRYCPHCGMQEWNVYEKRETGRQALSLEDQEDRREEKVDGKKQVHRPRSPESCNGL